MRRLHQTLVCIYLTVASCYTCAQAFIPVQLELPPTIAANTTFSIVATSRGSCTYPYPQDIQPPDFQLLGNQFEITVYLRPFGQNIVPVPPCLNRTQTYLGPALPSGTFNTKVFVRYFQDIGSGSFGSRLASGEFTFQVAEAVPITQIPATSNWSLALFLLGIFGAARWASGVSGR